MSYNPIDDNGRIVTLRKPARCGWCGELLPAGSKAVTRTYTWDGELCDERMHAECFEAGGRTGDYDPWGEGYEPHSMVRGQTLRKDEVKSDQKGTP